MYVDYRKVQNIPKSRNKRKFALPGVFCLLWASKQQIRAIWRVSRLPVTACRGRETRVESSNSISNPTPRRFWSCTREEDRFSLCLIPIKRNFHGNSQALGNGTESKDAAFDSCPMLNYNFVYSMKMVMLLLHSDWMPVNNAL